MFGYKGIYKSKHRIKSPSFCHRRPNFNRAMEESFRARIDKVFGSLASSSASSAPVSSLWCLAEDEIDSNERSGEKDVSEPSSSFPDIRTQENEPTDISIDGEEGQSSGLQKPSDYDDEEWEIKNSIGMDSTLDMEVSIYILSTLDTNFASSCFQYHRNKLRVLYIFSGRGR